MAYQLAIDKGSGENEPVRLADQDVFVADLDGVVKSVDEKNRTLTIVGSDETVDRDGDIIEVKGWLLDNFIKNPVFLYAHNYSSIPIGGAKKVTKRKNPVRLEFLEQFPPVDLYPFADLIYELFKLKFLNASSVGFIPMSWKAIDEENDPRGWNGRRYLEQELLELSACPVPCNPSALQSALKSVASRGSKIAKDRLQLMNDDGLNFDTLLSEGLLNPIEGDVDHILEAVNVRPMLEEKRETIIQVPVSSDIEWEKATVLMGDDIEVTSKDPEERIEEKNSKAAQTLSEDKDEELNQIKITVKEVIDPYHNLVINALMALQADLLELRTAVNGGLIERSNEIVGESDNGLYEQILNNKTEMSDNLNLQELVLAVRNLNEQVLKLG